MKYRIYTVLSAAALLAALLLIVLLPPSARAQVGAANASNAVVQGVGNVTLKRPAAVLRMHLQLNGKGKTLEESFEKLETRCGEVTAKLQKLNADTDSIEWGKPGLSAVESAYQKQFEALVRQRLGSGKAIPKGLKVPKTVTTTVMLKVEWPLTVESHEKLLVTTHALQEQIRAADLAGLKQPAKLSPEEQELAEEMAAVMNNHGEERPQVGKPHFVYVARITDQQRDEAMAEAFQKSRAAAERLARAAGAKLGPLVSLSGSGSGSNSGDGDEYYGGRNYAQRQYWRQMMAMQSSGDSDTLENETVAVDPAKLRFQFFVRAAFGIEK